MRLALVDSSAFLSLEDQHERAHRICLEALDNLAASGVKLLTTNFVFDEAYTLILTRLGRERAIQWGTSFKAGKLVQLVRVDSDHEARAWEILLAFADKDFSYTDATSFAVAEAFAIESAFALDRHFRQFGGFSVVP